MALVPVLTLGAVLLVVSGVIKLRHPQEAQAAVLQFGFPVGLAPVIGAVELCVGLLALIARWPLLAAAQACLYLVFAFVVERLRAEGGAASCGCFGQRSAAPSRVHTALDLALAAGATASAIWPSQPVLWIAATHPLIAAVSLLGTAAAASLAVAVIAYAPPLLSAYQRETM